ncbi:hypothetical protein C4D60_Mb00t00370 [Musa balbisiana]|uniref:Uncharacterized protein n=1 Tax=Musa balbisiana TaxID=52838 RepID=A0A4S8I608_MUSBA|nr:hypothetical protein C4D60_Mb00t00370 [Musa balbisiana]
MCPYQNPKIRSYVTMLLSVVSQIRNEWLTSALLDLGAQAVESKVSRKEFSQAVESRVSRNWVKAFPSPFSPMDS